LNTKILIVAFAGLSLVAAAQSPADKQKSKTSTTQAPSKDAAKDQRLGNKTAHDSWDQTAAKPTSGKKTAQDSWQQTAAKPASGSGTKPTPVAISDVNGDGRLDVAVSKNSAPPAGSSKDQAPRDTASGQTSGKRQHQSIRVIKEVDAASPHVATGDVNGNGAPDMAANSAHATEALATRSSTDQAPRDAAKGQTTGKRQHQPVTITKEADKAPK
jgi:hypothetical protein